MVTDKDRMTFSCFFRGDQGTCSVCQWCEAGLTQAQRTGKDPPEDTADDFEHRALSNSSKCSFDIRDER